jgi:hypothetical protein
MRRCFRCACPANTSDSTDDLVLGFKRGHWGKSSRQSRDGIRGDDNGLPASRQLPLMRPSPLTRLLWLLQDMWELSPLARLRGRVHALRDTRGAKVVAGLIVALLVVAGFIAARTVARAPDIASPRLATRVITVHQRVLRRVGDRLGTRGRLRTVYARGRTAYAHGPRMMIQRPALRTVNAVRVVTIPGGSRDGGTRTVLTPVTHTATQTGTRLVTVTHPITVVRTTTVVRTATVVRTTTVVSIKTVSVPITITVTVP